MPMIPPAPPELSMRNGCFSTGVIEAPSVRASVSVGPPAAPGTTIVIGFAG
jgi:hypothetical protein